MTWEVIGTLGSPSSSSSSSVSLSLSLPFGHHEVSTMLQLVILSMIYNASSQVQKAKGPRDHVLKPPKLWVKNKPSLFISDYLRYFAIVVESWLTPSTFPFYFICASTYQHPHYEGLWGELFNWETYFSCSKLGDILSQNTVFNWVWILLFCYDTKSLWPSSPEWKLLT